MNTNDVEVNLRVNISAYEELCESNCAQYREAKVLLVKIKNALNFMGKEYCSINLARYGSKRSMDYIKRGLVDGFTLDSSGKIIETES